MSVIWAASQGKDRMHENPTLALVRLLHSLLAIRHAQLASLAEKRSVNPRQRLVLHHNRANAQRHHMLCLFQKIALPAQLRKRGQPRTAKGPISTMSSSAIL